MLYGGRVLYLIINENWSKDHGPKRTISVPLSHHGCNCRSWRNIIHRLIIRRECNLGQNEIKDFKSMHFLKIQIEKKYKSYNQLIFWILAILLTHPNFDMYAVLKRYWNSAFFFFYSIFSITFIIHWFHMHNKKVFLFPIKAL